MSTFRIADVKVSVTNATTYVSNVNVEVTSLTEASNVKRWRRVKQDVRPMSRKSDMAIVLDRLLSDYIASDTNSHVISGKPSAGRISVPMNVGSGAKSCEPYIGTLKDDEDTQDTQDETEGHENQSPGWHEMLPEGPKVIPSKQHEMHRKIHDPALPDGWKGHSVQQRMDIGA